MTKQALLNRMKRKTKARTIYPVNPHSESADIKLRTVPADAVAPTAHVNLIELYRQDECLTLEFNLDEVSRQVQIVVRDAASGQVLRVISAMQALQPTDQDQTLTGVATHKL